MVKWRYWDIWSEKIISWWNWRLEEWEVVGIEGWEYVFVNEGCDVVGYVGYGY